eukprot:6174259-Pleurochrysis_carterae.AAC.3
MSSRASENFLHCNTKHERVHVDSARRRVDLAVDPQTLLKHAANTAFGPSGAVASRLQLEEDIAVLAPPLRLGEQVLGMRQLRKRFPELLATTGQLTLHEIDQLVCQTASVLYDPRVREEGVHAAILTSIPAAELAARQFDRLKIDPFRIARDVHGESDGEPKEEGD